MRKSILTLALCAMISAGSLPAFAKETPRDNFFWLGQINKASDVINTDEGLLTPEEGHSFARGIDKVLKEGNLPNAPRPRNVVAFEPYLIKAAGPDVTKIHAGRSSQDMLTTVGIMEQREHLLTMAKKLNQVQEDFIRLAEENKNTLIPNYTNGVAAHPNSLAHYFIAYANAYGRDMQRVREYYKRLNRSPMGSTVLNGTGRPDRDRMAEYLGFDGLAYNTYDAGQIFPKKRPSKPAASPTASPSTPPASLKKSCSSTPKFRPWIILKEGGGNTYVSSAMPQKRNPGLLNSCRTDASTLLGMSVEAMFRSHNIPAGMADGRLSGARDIMPQASKVLTSMDKILNNLVIDPARSLEELNLDWTCSQEIADELMKNHGIPFRMGHHFASEIVTYARAHDITPRDFTYEDAKAIYAKVCAGDPHLPRDFPMTEEEWEHAKDPAPIVRNRKVKGGPQMAELDKMIQMAKEELSDNKAWTEETEKKLASAEQKLNQDFDKLL